MNLILFGPPGAGKGTQAQFIVKEHNYFQLSTGDLLRNEIQQKTLLGNEINEIISKGNFVSDLVVNTLLKQSILKLKSKDRIVFDGYPRNLSQAQNLNEILSNFNERIGAIIFLNVEREIIEKRIIGRMICEKCNMIFNEFSNKNEIENHECGKKFLIKRKDDNHQIVLSRYDTYMEQTKPLLEFYSSSEGFLEIDGSLEIAAIRAKIEGILKF